MSTTYRGINIFKSDMLWPAAWLALFSTPTVAFLVVYIGLHSANPDAIFPHLHVFVLLLTGALGLRIVAGNALRPSARASRVFRATIASFFLYALIIYYLIAIVGLYSWSRIFTFDLVSAYSGRPFLQILESFHIPVLLLFALLILGFVALFWLCLYFENNIEASAPFPARISRFPLTIIGALLILISGFGMLAFSGNPRGDLEEPFALTFYPARFGDRLQGISINHSLARRYDVEATQERAKYRISGDADQAPNVILFIVDGLRPDHMGMFGYSRNTTPFLDKVKANGKVRHFGSLHSVCADSTCGLLALASARYPHELSPGFFSLYEVLEHAGYRTSLVLSGDHKGFYGLADLYGSVDSLTDGNDYTRVAVNDDSGIFEMLQSVPAFSGSPSFFQFHLMSAHNLGTRWESMQEYKPSKNYGFRVLRGSHQESINFYDNGVRQTDHVIENVMQKLREKGYLDRYIVIITSDHGEALGEHGAWSHSEEVIEPALKIPFVVISENARKETSDKPQQISFGSIVDIAPTLVDLLGLPKPGTWSGRSLFTQSEPRTIFFRQEERAGLVQTSSDGLILKYWRNTRTGDEFVFDLTSDPQESKNLLGMITDTKLADWRLQTLKTIALVDTRITD
ncbi:MAG: sulfatase-like hydrolase/transferase [Wenzhouxiangellaceae bacterium]